MTAIEWIVVIVGHILWYSVGYSQGIKNKKYEANRKIHCGQGHSRDCQD